ncbi:uncharacterized protein Ecym_1374 [Eremothecium cymbalariae DBVPG|uniref:Uncharacterized protein n=1 Tax=Eremothecium cymbalariae (strain CBS 270.75 / DBVPG 7215 / KCTC 17166 / NRRL Y-17582) TaxID=931890 RepID=G8JNE3_ERECY|nr:hypothetical protein Ecym_1374 [Eremothecium cymbalariae DBVPG\
MKLKSNEYQSLNYSLHKLSTESNNGRLLYIYPVTSRCGDDCFIIVFERSVGLLVNDDTKLKLEWIANNLARIQKISFSDKLYVLQGETLTAYSKENISVCEVLHSSEYSKGIRLFKNSENLLFDSQHSTRLFGPLPITTGPQILFQFNDQLIDFTSNKCGSFALLRCSYSMLYYIQKFEYEDPRMQHTREVYQLDHSNGYLPLTPHNLNDSKWLLVITYNYAYFWDCETMETHKFGIPSFIKDCVSKRSKIYISQRFSALVLHICSQDGYIYKSELNLGEMRKLHWVKVNLPPSCSIGIHDSWHLDSERYILLMDSELVLVDLQSKEKKRIEYQSIHKVIYDSQVISPPTLLVSNKISAETISCGSLMHDNPIGLIHTDLEVFTVKKQIKSSLQLLDASNIWYSLKGIFIENNEVVKMEGFSSKKTCESFITRTGTLHFIPSYVSHATVINRLGTANKYIVLKGDGIICGYKEGDFDNYILKFDESCNMASNVLIASYETEHILRIAVLNDNILKEYKFERCDRKCDFYELKESYTIGELPVTTTSMHMNQEGIFVLSNNNLHTFLRSTKQGYISGNVMINAGYPLRFCDNLDGSLLLFYDFQHIYKYDAGILLKTNLPCETKKIIVFNEEILYILGIDSILRKLIVSTEHIHKEYLESGLVFTRLLTLKEKTCAVIVGRKLNESNINEKLILFDYLKSQNTSDYSFSEGEIITHLLRLPSKTVFEHEKSVKFIVGTVREGGGHTIYLFSIDDGYFSVQNRIQLNWLVTTIEPCGSVIIIAGEKLLVCSISENKNRWQFEKGKLAITEIRSELVMAGALHDSMIILFDAFKGIEAYNLTSSPTGYFSLTPSDVAAGYPRVTHYLISRYASCSIRSSATYNFNAAAVTDLDVPRCLDTQSLFLDTSITFIMISDAKGCLYLYQFSPFSVLYGKNFCSFTLSNEIMAISPIPQNPLHNLDSPIPLFAVLTSDNIVHILSYGKSKVGGSCVDIHCLESYSDSDLSTYVETPYDKRFLFNSIHQPNRRTTPNLLVSPPVAEPPTHYDTSRQLINLHLHDVTSQY